MTACLSLFSLFSRCSPPRLSAAPPAVILTRERGKNSKLDALLRERGVPTAELPCIAFQQLPAGQAELSPALAEETPAWVVVTSPEAAGVLAEGWERAGRPHLRLASVGGATAKALQSLGLRSAFTPTKATGRALAEELPLDHGDSGGGDGAPPAVLYPCSALAADTVCAGLERRGFGVRRIDTYTTVAAEWGPSEEEAARAASVVSFGSPSAVRVWHERVCPWWRERPASRARVAAPPPNHSPPLQVGSGAVAACIGETSAAQARELGFSQVIAPDSPGVEAWAETILSLGLWGPSE